MPHITYTQTAIEDLGRLADFMQSVSPQTKDKMIDSLQQGISNLSVFPEIGRVSHIKDMRELAIPFGKGSYSVLYRYLKDKDRVDVTALKHSRELKYSVE